MKILSSKRMGAKVRRLRKLAGMSRGAVARRAGIDPETVRRVETGKGSPRVVTVAAVARALRAEPETILFGNH